jgi:mono/diheme cytochrome c family protein
MSGGVTMSLAVRTRVLLTILWLAATALLIFIPRTATADDQPPVLAERARLILKARCYACHGANGAAKKNVFVLDRNRLVAAKTVIAGDPNSLLLKLVESGVMPVGGPELSSEEKASLRNWVLSGAPNWDAETTEAKRAFLTEAAILARIRNDLLSAPERSRPFLRYFSLAHLFNAGVADEELATYRAALSKLVNSLSWHREITPLTAIDGARTIFRADLRDYNWTDATWNRILAVYPYGIRVANAEAIARLSGAALPYVRADWFAANASSPPLYHDILGLPKNVQELERQLGIDSVRDFIEEKNVVRAGLRSSGVSQNNRVLERHVSPHGAYWKSFDFRSSQDDQNIFKDPLRLNPAGGEIIFNLPNGLQGYFLMNAIGSRLDEAPITIVADRNNTDDPVIRNGRSCMSCHYAGMQAFKDDVRPIVRGLSFALFDGEKVLAIYPAQESLDQLIDRDRDRFQRAAEQAGGRAVSPQAEPINALARRFLSEMPVAQAAAEAGLETRNFQARIAVSERLLALGYGQLLVARGGIKREVWDKSFGELARELELGEPVARTLAGWRRAPLNAADTDNLAGNNRGTVRSVGTSGDPAAILRTARTIFVRSMTVYLEPEQLESELRKRTEFKSMELAIVKDEKVADIRIEINRAEFSFNYAFTATNPQTSMVVASGKVTAWNGGFAAPQIAKEFLQQVKTARGRQ